MRIGIAVHLLYPIALILAIMIASCAHSSGPKSDAPSFDVGSLRSYPVSIPPLPSFWLAARNCSKGEGKATAALCEYLQARKQGNWSLAWSSADRGVEQLLHVLHESKDSGTLAHLLLVAGMLLDLGDIKGAGKLLSQGLEKQIIAKARPNQVAEILVGLSLVAFRNGEPALARRLAAPVEGMGQSNRGEVLQECAWWIESWSSFILQDFDRARKCIERVVPRHGVSMCGFVPKGDKELSNLSGWLYAEMEQAYKMWTGQKLERRQVGCMGWDGGRKDVPEALRSDAAGLVGRLNHAPSLPPNLLWVLPDDIHTCLSVPEADPQQLCKMEEKNQKVLLYYLRRIWTRLEAAYGLMPFDIDKLGDPSHASTFARMTMGVIKGKVDFLISKRDEGYGLAQFIRAWLLLLQGVDVEAYSDFNALVQDEHATDWHFRARIGMAQLLYRQGFYKQAIKMLGRGKTGREVERLTAGYLLGWSQAGVGDLLAAKRTLERVGRRSGDKPRDETDTTSKRVQVLRMAARRDAQRLTPDIDLTARDLVPGK